MSEKVENLFTALNAAQAVMSGAKKDAENPHLRSKYADLASVWDACRGPLTSNGLAVIQMPSSDGPEVTVTTLLTHKSGEWIASDLTLTSDKNTPQGAGSAITYARRYGLSAMAGIAPEDDDGNEAEGRNKKTGSREQQQEVANRKLGRPSGPPETPVEESTQKGPQAVSTTKDGVFLAQTKAFKDSLQEPLYRYVLKRAGYEKSNEAVTPEQKSSLLKKLAAAQKVATVAKNGEFMPNLMPAEVFALLPETSIAAILKEFRAKLTKACGGVDIAQEEYESARGASLTQWDFCNALQRKVEHYGQQGVA